MTRFLFLAILLLTGLSACKKKYNCSCTTTVYYVYNQQSYVVSDTKPMDKKLSKKEASAVCDHEAKNINDTYTNLFTNNGNQSSNSTRANTSCVLK